MREPIYYCKGKYLPASQTTLSVTDLGLVRGFGLFESLRTYGGKPLLLGEHLKRFFHGTRKMGLHPPLDRQGMTHAILRVLQKNHFEESLVKIILTGGKSKGLLPQGRPSLVIMGDPFHPFPAWQYEKGIKLMGTKTFRIHPGIKTTNYFSAVLETRKAVQRGFTEVVYLDKKGGILEGSTFNFFAVLPGPRLVTPREGVLPGITGQQVMSLAKKMRIPVVRSPVTSSMLQKAREAFITSSNRELIPAIQVDGLKIGNGRPGPITRQLHAAYLENIPKWTRN